MPLRSDHSRPSSTAWTRSYGPRCSNSRTRSYWRSTSGTAESTQLTSGGRDLDNYPFPIVARLARSASQPRSPASNHGPSAIAIGPAHLTDEESPGHWAHGSAPRTASSATTAGSTSWRAAGRLHARAGPVTPNWPHRGPPGLPGRPAPELDHPVEAGDRRVGGVLGVDNPPSHFIPG
jgi:hypothetical protein